MKKVILITIMLGAMLWAIEPFTGTCGPTPWWLHDNSGSQNEDRYRGICVINDSLAWVVGWDHWENGRVWKRTGAKHSHNWIPETISVINQNEYHFNDVFFVDENHGWIVGEKKSGSDKYKGVVVWTNNGGESWHSPTSTPTFLFPTPFLKVKMVQVGSDYYGYITCGNGIVLKTDDGGLNWRRTDSDPWNDDNNISVWYNGLWVDPNNSDKLWVGGDAFGVLAKSDSGGISWTSYQSSEFETTYTFPQGAGAPYGTRFANFDVEFVDPDTGFVALSYGKIGKTADGGATWTRSTYQPASTWFRDATEGRGDTCFAVGNCGVVHRFNHADSQECFDNLITRRGSDLYCVDAKGSYYPYSAGDSWYGTTIRQRYKVANFSSCEANARRNGVKSKHFTLIPQGPSFLFDSLCF